MPNLPIRPRRRALLRGPPQSIAQLSQVKILNHNFKILIMITYSDSFSDFLSRSKSKIARLLYRAKYLDYPSYRLMLTTDEVSYPSLRADGNISYLPADRQLEYNADGQWSRQRRQDGKPA